MVKGQTKVWTIDLLVIVLALLSLDFFGVSERRLNT